MKKAQGISINTIIVAAIALIVLVVLIMVFTGRMSLFGLGLDRAQEGDYCPQDMVQAISCGEGQAHLLGPFKQCTDETPSEFSDRCARPGYICCSPT